jgi:hypothetical protein
MFLITLTRHLVTGIIINCFEQSKVSSCESFAYVVRRDMDFPEADERP